MTSNRRTLKRRAELCLNCEDRAGSGGCVNGVCARILTRVGAGVIAGGGRAALSRARTINLEQIGLVSWDVDGTLYSVSRLKWRLAGMLLREAARGRGAAARGELAALLRYRTKVEAARRAGGVLGGALRDADSRQALLDLELRWYGRAIKETGTRAGVGELLSFFNAGGVPQVVLSDYPAAYKLDSLGIRDRFAAVYVGESLGCVKPNPKAFERIAADFRVPPGNILHIGDRGDTDGAAARAAGCRCLILGRDFRSFDALLKRLRAVA